MLEKSDAIDAQNCGKKKTIGEGCTPVCKPGVCKTKRSRNPKICNPLLSIECNKLLCPQPKHCLPNRKAKRFPLMVGKSVQTNSVKYKDEMSQYPEKHEHYVKESEVVKYDIRKATGEVETIVKRKELYTKFQQAAEGGILQVTESLTRFQKNGKIISEKVVAPHVKSNATRKSVVTNFTLENNNDSAPLVKKEKEEKGVTDFNVSGNVRARKRTQNIVKVNNRPDSIVRYSGPSERKQNKSEKSSFMSQRISTQSERSAILKSIGKYPHRSGGGKIDNSSSEYKNKVIKKNPLSESELKQAPACPSSFASSEIDEIGEVICNCVLCPALLNTSNAENNQPNWSTSENPPREDVCSDILKSDLPQKRSSANEQLEDDITEMSKPDTSKKITSEIETAPHIQNKEYLENISLPDKKITSEIETAPHTQKKEYLENKSLPETVDSSSSPPIASGTGIPKKGSSQRNSRQISDSNGAPHTPNKESVENTSLPETVLSSSSPPIASGTGILKKGSSQRNSLQNSDSNVAPYDQPATDQSRSGSLERTAPQIPSSDNANADTNGVLFEEDEQRTEESLEQSVPVETSSERKKEFQEDEHKTENVLEQNDDPRISGQIIRTHVYKETKKVFGDVQGNLIRSYEIESDSEEEEIEEDKKVEIQKTNRCCLQARSIPCGSCRPHFYPNCCMCGCNGCNHPIRPICNGQCCSWNCGTTSKCRHSRNC